VRKFLSLLSVPILIIPLTLITLWLLKGSHETSFRWFQVFLLNLIFLPTIAVFWLRDRHFISDVDLRNKQERLVFMGLMLILSLTNYFDSTILTAPRLIQSLNLLVFLLILSMSVITLFWKISGHMLILSSMILVAYFMKGAPAQFLFLILPPVALHRYFLKHHSPTQIVAGTVLGFALTFAVLKFSGF